MQKMDSQFTDKHLDYLVADLFDAVPKIAKAEQMWKIHHFIILAKGYQSPQPAETKVDQGWTIDFRERGIIIWFVSTDIINNNRALSFVETGSVPYVHICSYL